MNEIGRLAAAMIPWGQKSKTSQKRGSSHSHISGFVTILSRIRARQRNSIAMIWMNYRDPSPHPHVDTPIHHLSDPPRIDFLDWVRP